MHARWFILLMGAITPASALPGQTHQFSDQTTDSGLIATHDPMDPHILLTGGGAVGDFDNDGDQDVLHLSSGESGPDKLFINNGGGTFTDLAASWGVARVHYGFGAAVGDYNNDGWLDIYVTSGGDSGFAAVDNHILYRNNGDGTLYPGTQPNTFTDVAADAGVLTTSTGFSYDGFSPAFGDYDLDGDLDLAVAAWQGEPNGNRLFMNNGDGTFSDVTQASLPIDIYTRGFSPRFADMNRDRYPELLWVSDFRTSKYFINEKNGTFTDHTLLAGAGLDGNGMGSCVADLNRDGRLDWYVSSIHTLVPVPGEPVDSVPGTGNMLYMNDGEHHFAETAVSAGVNDGGWGWGCVAIDVNHDALVDIIETNGWFSRTEWINENSYVFVNNGDGTFTDRATDLAFNGIIDGRGIANFDYDNDGDQDILIFGNRSDAGLLRNDLAGPATNWLRLFFDTRLSPTLAPNGYGTWVTLTAGGITQHAYLAGGSNYLSQSELSLHFGLADAAQVDELTIEWADGRVARRHEIAPNQTMTITACPCDHNDSNDIDVLDLLAYLADWFPGSPNADINLDGTTDVLDALDFLACWFVGEPC